MEQELNRKTMVIGHRNPDTDSICSAIAYSYLLNATNKYNAVPVRLGEINRETEYVLKRFGVEHPVLLKTVKQKVEDLNYDKVTVFSKDLTLKTAWFLLKQQNLKSAPILDEHGQLLGLLSTSNINAFILFFSKNSIDISFTLLKCAFGYSINFFLLVLFFKLYNNIRKVAILLLFILKIFF